MEIIEHGVYFAHEITLRCEECDCKYKIDDEIDLYKYEKPIKVWMLSVGDSWTEKRYYYTICPECRHKNPITNYEYSIVSKRVVGDE